MSYRRVVPRRTLSGVWVYMVRRRPVAAGADVKDRRGLLTLLAFRALLDASMPPKDPSAACKVCGGSERNETGECYRCGAYQCKECKLYHLGDPTKPCPGHGVDVP